MTEFVGCDKLRDWAESVGFKIEKNNLKSPHNLCNWHGFKKLSSSARDCKTNEKPPKIVIEPYQLTGPYGAPAHRSCGYSIVGEANGVWYQLSAYSLPIDDAISKFKQIEESLCVAWNSLDRGE